MSFPRAGIPLALLLGACPCAGLLLQPEKGGKGKYGFTSFGDASMSTCTQVCASLSLACDLENLPWKNDKDMKQEVKDLDKKCKGTENSGSIAAPWIEVKDAKDDKGTCHYPKDFKSLSCDAPAPVNTRRLCYCTEEALPVEEYDSIWPYGWVFPAGEGQSVDPNRYEVCACYAKMSGEVSTIPPELFSKETEYSGNGAYTSGCATFCKDQKSGQHHAADLHMLADWSTGRPCIIVVHGQGGSKDEQYTQMMAKKFADAGFIVMALNYNADTCEDDIGAAVEYMQTIGLSLGVDPNSVALYGWSQGGRCVYKAGYKNLKVPNRSVKAVIDMSGCGGKGPLNSVDQSVKTMPPPLLLAHAENDNTIKIDDCRNLVAHSKKKSWDDNGSKGIVFIKELYFAKGGHNLVKHSETEPVVIDEIFNHLFQYLGRPCRWETKLGIFGNTPMDKGWPTCKTMQGESTDRCGGAYTDFSLVSKDCKYP